MTAEAREPKETEEGKQRRLNAACEQRLLAALEAIGNYTTNLVTLDGVILAVTVTVFPKKLSDWPERVTAVGGWLSLLASIAMGLITLSRQIEMLSGSGPVAPRASNVQRGAFWTVGFFFLGLVLLFSYSIVASAWT